LNRSSAPNSAPPLRIGIASPSVAIESISHSFRSLAPYSVIWLAREGHETLIKCNRQPPDVLILDLFLPPINGLDITRQIMAQCPCAILLLTGNSSVHAPEILQALNQGALDIARTSLLNPSPQASSNQASSNQASSNQANSNPSIPPLELDDICRKIQLVNKRYRQINDAKPTPAKPTISGTLPSAFREDRPTTSLPIRTATAAPTSTRRWDMQALPALLVIGSSTGGPKALGQILAEFPADLAIAIVIIQHVDRQFAASLATWLDEQTPLPVRLAVEGDRIQSGQVLIAGTNDHLICKPNLELAYVSEPADYAYRPSVDVFFHSIVQHWPTTGMAALLTGMGRDGAIGLGELRKRGWQTIAQDQATCAVYGMPKAAAELKAAMRVLPIEQIGPACLRHFTRT
jgi:two-component system, chemotaxis family, response regulator WspF